MIPLFPTVFCETVQPKDKIAVMREAYQSEKASRHRNYVPTVQARREPPLKWEIKGDAFVKAPEAVKKRKYNRATRRNPWLLAKASRQERAMELMTTDKAFGNTIEEMFRLKKREECRDLGIRRPAPYCFNIAMRLLISARLKMEGQFTEPSIGIDTDGSIHVHWIGSGREMTLVVPTRAMRPYVYHEEQDKYAVDENVTVGSLKSWIEWLANNEKSQGAD